MALSDADTPARRGADLMALPGLRAFANGRFRMLVAGVLWAAGTAVLALVLVHQASLPLVSGQYGIDFNDYRTAATRMASGQPPYAAAMLEGPIPAQGVDRYRYPPILAQLLIPLAGLPLALDNSLWLLVQAGCVYGGVWVAGTAGGLRPTRERAFWTGVATTYFLPVFQTLWMGNVSGVAAGLVGLAAYAGVRGGSALAGLGLLKGTAGLSAPIALFAGRRSALTAVGTTAAGIAVSAALAPVAWIDYLRIIPNLIAGSADYATNLAPDQLLAHGIPSLGAWSGPIRLLAVLAGTGALVGACWLARRRGGWSSALVLATAASLLIPSALWYHYLAVLLPLAALAWRRAGRIGRISLVAGGALVSLGLADLILALGGALAITLVSAWVLRPRAPMSMKAAS